MKMKVKMKVKIKCIEGGTNLEFGKIYDAVKFNYNLKILVSNCLEFYQIKDANFGDLLFSTKRFILLTEYRDSLLDSLLSNK